MVAIRVGKLYGIGVGPGDPELLTLKAFRLLEMLDEGAPKPALILGFPVGFVGALESKAALAADSRGIPFLTIHGRRGGSAMAAAAVNALAMEQE